MTFQVLAPTAADTRAVGGRLAGLVRPGDLVVLSGMLGSGKTTLVGGLADGLGIDGPVTSPTFVLVRRYPDGFLPLVHADAYRLGSLGEFDDLDLWEQAQDGVLVIEWGEAVQNVFPEDHLRVEIGIGPDGVRLLDFHPGGSWCHRPLEEVVG
ncbi:MAG: tRNA (adenosine(37)-N6)-threonylcarbamoyltransferase complex ATPase subunit type 1 TsaE [Acidimicrobiia bacterium]